MVPLRTAQAYPAPKPITFSLSSSTRGDIAEFWAVQAEAHATCDSITTHIKAIAAEEKEHGTQDLLGKGPHTLETALYWMSAVPKGRALLKQLLPVWDPDSKKRGLHFESASGAEGIRYNQNPESMAFFIRDTVYINYEFSFVVLLASLFHEMIHAKQILVDKGGADKQAVLDRLNQIDSLYEHWSGMGAGEGTGVLGGAVSGEVTRMVKELGESLAKAKKEAFPILLGMEHHAYRAQDDFIAELFELGGEFRNALADRIHARQWLAYPIDEPLFRRLMQYERGFNMPEEIVDAYFKEIPFSTYQ
ncbi:MAG: hypothetical protein R3B54_16330 [Bdellovibrionota bacterium]